MKKDTYMVSIDCSWIEPIKANSIEEAIAKVEKRYKHGKGRFPREYVEVSECCDYWCQIED